jgi:hypothetical protein
MGWALVAELDLGSLELLQGAGRKEMASGFTLLNRTGFSEEPMWGEGKALKVTSKVLSLYLKAVTHVSPWVWDSLPPWQTEGWV